MKCSIFSCNRMKHKSAGFGYCLHHYYRYKRYGSPSKDGIGRGNYKRTEEHRKSISRASKLLYASGYQSPAKGRKLSDEEKKKIGTISKMNWKKREFRKKMKNRYHGSHSEERKRKAKELFTGERNPRWKGGISSETDRIRHTRELKEWRKRVFQRDNYTCQDCGQRGGYLEAHHIKEFSRYPELRESLDNGLTLCKNCHVKTDNYAWKVKVTEQEEGDSK